MLVSRNFLRLPPLLRVVDIVALLLALAALPLLGIAVATNLPFLPSAHPVSLDGGIHGMHFLLLGANVALLSIACSQVVDIYGLRFRQPAGGPFPLSSWRSQLRVVALLGALPLGALMLLLILPPGFPAFYLLFAASLLGAVVVFLTWAWTTDAGASRRLLRIRWRWVQ